MGPSNPWRACGASLGETRPAVQHRIRRRRPGGDRGRSGPGQDRPCTAIPTAPTLNRRSAARHPNALRSIVLDGAYRSPDRIMRGIHLCARHARQVQSGLCALPTCSQLPGTSLDHINAALGELRPLAFFGSRLRHRWSRAPFYRRCAATCDRYDGRRPLPSPQSGKSTPRRAHSRLAIGCRLRG